MKTQILTLDVHDDYISARDKISWTKAGWILLVWPEGGRILDRYLDLVLLLRHTNLMGAQLALVNTDRQVRYHARLLSIPVFNNLVEAQRSKRRPGRRQHSRIRLGAGRRERSRPDFETLYATAHPQQPRWQQHPLARSIFFTMGVLALLAIASLLAPEAHITVQPRTQVQAVEFEVQANPKIKTVNISGNLPLQFRTVIVEGRAAIPVSGSARAPQDFATGTIRLTNLSEQKIHLAQDTVVRTPSEAPVRFVLTRAGDLPAGVGQSVSLPIQAILPGRRGNLPGGMLTVVERPQALNLVATNQAPTTGGSDLTVPAPSTEDQAKLYETLEGSLRLPALEQLRAQGSQGDYILTSGLTLAQVLEKTYDPPTLQPSEELSLVLRLEYQAPVIVAGDLHTLAITVLDANLEPGFLPVENTLQIAHLDSPQVDEGQSFTWKLKAERTIEAQISSSHLVNLVAGLPLPSAIEKLSDSLPIQSKPVVTISPGWWPRLPFLPFRIHVSSP